MRGFTPMNKKESVLALLQKIFIWSKEDKESLQKRISLVNEKKDVERLQEVERYLKKVMKFQKETLQKAQKENSEFYTKLSVKITEVYKKTAEEAAKKDKKDADTYLDFSHV